MNINPLTTEHNAIAQSLKGYWLLLLIKELDCVISEYQKWLLIL